MFVTRAEARRPAYTRPNSDTARSDNASPHDDDDDDDDDDRVHKNK